MRRFRIARDQRGFTLVEVLVAAFVLVVGVLGAVALVDAANGRTSATKSREAASSLARELVEQAYALPYQQLNPSEVPARLKGRPGLADADAGSGWTVRRRDIAYDVRVDVCSVDDDRDGTGQGGGGLCSQAASATGAGSPCDGVGVDVGAAVGDVVVPPVQGCTNSDLVQVICRATGLSGTTGVDGSIDLIGASAGAEVSLCATTGSANDSAPDDYKRLVVNVSWSEGRQARRVRQATILTNPGGANGPGIQALAARSASPVTDPALTSVAFDVATSSRAVTVAWSVDGAVKGSAQRSPSDPTRWTFSWPLDGLGDGTYLVGAQAFDSAGRPGAERALSVTLNRRTPAAPGGLLAGRNNGVVDLEWQASRDADVIGYRIFRRDATGDVAVCGLAMRLACQDTSPPLLDPAQYYAVAYDRDPRTNEPRPGEASPIAGTSATNLSPNPPTGLTATATEGTTVLQWTAPSPADPDPGDDVAYYRIYRDGATYGARYDRTGSSTQTTWTDRDPGGREHTYYVTAVDRQLKESVVVGPVTR